MREYDQTQNFPNLNARKTPGLDISWGVKNILIINNVIFFMLINIEKITSRLQN
jgi:hypothetical protein